MEDLLPRLRRREIVIADGAWGSLLMARGLQPGACPELFHLEQPDVVAEIATLYLDAGAGLVTTNTFGGSPLKLAPYGLENRTEEINRRAVEIVREVVGDRAWVSASVGPSGTILKPYGDTDERAVEESFRRQIRVLADAGADLICVETMTDLREASLAVKAAKEIAPSLPVMATMTFDRIPRGFFTIMGVSVEQAATGLAGAGADVVGSNCGHGSDEMIEIARELTQCSALPILIQPNAGLPETRDGNLVYPESPEFMAERARILADLGVAVIGGCCGTTPEHIRAMRERIPGQ
jgi:5-methyltetrahydrofolate--homocysteine methyltransferase